jgi:hypothetical protein
MDSCEEVSSGFFVAGCDCPELFESIEETLDEVAFGVEGEVAWAVDLAVSLGRDHRLDAAHGQGSDETVGVVTFVSDEGLRLDFGEQRFGLGYVVSLTARQADRQRIAERIDDGVNLGGQSAARSPDRFRPAVFLGAPALC